MSDDKRPVQFFLGANTPKGFISLFDDIADRQADWRSLVIKGGPGCGKSTLMRSVASALESQDSKIQYILCSADTESLDGLIFPQLKAAIVDGTPPHSIELHYPGAVESIVDMSCWQDNILYDNRKEIISQFEKSRQMTAQATIFLEIAVNLLDMNRDIALACTDVGKLNRLTRKICHAELPRKVGTGTDERRFLSAITADGVILLDKTISALADNVYLLEDNYGVFSPIMLAKIHSYALENGYNVISCFCPMHPHEKIEHLFIPELSLAFVTANHFHFTDVNPTKVINSRRFTDHNLLKPHKKTLALNKGSAKYMLELASGFLAEARTAHKKLEDCYNEAMDFDSNTAITERVIDKLKKMSEKQD